MKRLASILVVVAMFLTLGASKAWSQRSGSLQATAQVVDTRAAVSGLMSAQSLAASYATTPGQTAITETRFAQVSMRPRTVISTAGRTESELELRVDYLRN